MNLFQRYLNLGIEESDSLLRRRAKKIYNIDILVAISLPVLIVIFLLLNGYSNPGLSLLVTLFALLSLPHVFLVWQKKYDLSVIIFQSVLFVLLAWEVLTRGNFLTSIFMSIFAINVFIYFPEKKLALRMFLFFAVATIVLFICEIQMLEIESIDTQFWKTLQLNFSLFTFLLTFKIYSLVTLYWASVEEKEDTKNEMLETEDRYRSLFENVLDGICIVDLEQKKAVQYNQKLMDIFGVKTASGLEDFPFNNLPPRQPCGTTSINFLDEQTQQVLVLGKSRFTVDALRADGTRLQAEVKSFNLPKPNEHLAISIFKDVTEKKKQEETIQKNILELKEKKTDLEKYIESNMQLENFAYIASHDLKTPIRTIGSFSQILKNKAADKLNESELEYLDFIHQGAVSMQVLVEDLLTFSKVSTENKKLTLVKLPDLLDTIQQELRVSIQENNAVISCDNIPTTIYADSTKMRQLFQNLIANAIKFKKPNVAPQVEVSCKENQQYWHFSVKDNGIGIKPEFYDQVFMIFRKLHTAREYEGSGIGLSLCKKIVEQHHGSISLSSEFGQYTRFDFSIRKH